MKQIVTYIVPVDSQGGYSARDILTFLKNEYGNVTGGKLWETYLMFMAREAIMVGLKQTDSDC